MPRQGIRTVSVYVNDQQLEILSKAAAKQNRSLSNYLLNLGLSEAEAQGIQVMSAYRAPAPNEPNTPYAGSRD